MEQHLGKGRIMAKGNRAATTGGFRAGASCAPGMSQTQGRANRRGIHLCENHRGKAPLVAIWKKKGYVDRAMETWWSVDVYCYDPDGHCYARYNPTVKPGGAGFVIDFDWMPEGTPREHGKALGRNRAQGVGATAQSTSSTAA